MKKRIALLLSFVLVLSLALCACGGEEKKESVVGTWKTEINLADMFNQEMEASGMGEYINVETFGLPLVLELKEDGTGSMTVDAEAMDATLDKLAEDMAAGLEAYFADYFASMGLEIDVDEALAASGMSMDDLIDEMKAGFADESAYAEFTSEFRYKAEDGKLFMSEDLDSAIGATYNTYKIEGDTLTLDIGTEELDEESAEMLFPMVLKRAN